MSKKLQKYSDSRHKSPFNSLLVIATLNISLQQYITSILPQICRVFGRLLSLFSVSLFERHKHARVSDSLTSSEWFIMCASSMLLDTYIYSFYRGNYLKLYYRYWKRHNISTVRQRLGDQVLVSVRYARGVRRWRQRGTPLLCYYFLARCSIRESQTIRIAYILLSAQRKHQLFIRGNNMHAQTIWKICNCLSCSLI